MTRSIRSIRSKYAHLPYDMLGEAIRWETVRAKYFEATDELEKAIECQAKLRGYQRRAVSEAEDALGCVPPEGSFA